MSIILFFIVVVLLVMIITSTVRIVPQAHAYVVERLGAYQGTWSVGLHVKVPFIDRYRCIFSDHGSKIIQLWCRKSDHGD